MQACKVDGRECESIWYKLLRRGCSYDEALEDAGWNTYASGVGTR